MNAEIYTERMLEVVNQLTFDKELKISDIERLLNIKMHDVNHEDPFMPGKVNFTVYEWKSLEKNTPLAGVTARKYSEKTPGWGIISIELSSDNPIPWDNALSYKYGEKQGISPDAGGRLVSIRYQVGSSTVSFSKKRDADYLHDIVINRN